MKRNLLELVVAMMLVAVPTFCAFGQTATASLNGAITDPNGAVISGATVRVKNNATGAEFKATTASNGTYTVPSLGAGSYTVTIEAQGFKKAVLEGVKIDAGVPATANATLEVGAASESVVI